MLTILSVTGGIDNVLGGGAVVLPRGARVPETP
jgi:hypothetical protein